MSETGRHLDTALIEALTSAVRVRGQPEAVAKRLIAWVEQASVGELSKLDDERFLLSTLEALVIEEDLNAD